MSKLHFALIFSLFFIITGCTKKTSDEYIALAESKIQQEDFSTAIIELKNAIGVNARDPKSRFMLGNLYAQRGSSAAAEKELKLALEFGYEPNDVLPVLANVYSLQFKHAEIIELVESSRNLAPEVSTSLLLYKALAHFQQGEPYKAKKAVADANEISSDSLYSKLGTAYVDFSNNQVDVSLEKINHILKEYPDFADALLLKGQLTSATNDLAGAVESFEKYKTLLPRTFQSRVLLANAYFRNKQFAEAEKEVDLLLKANPEQPFINQLKGAIRFQDKDFDLAKLHIEKAIQNGLANTPNKIIAGVTAFRLGSNSLAYEYLNSIQDDLPPEHPIFRLLAILELKLGKSSDAGMTLTQLDGLSEDDVILLSAASAQLMREGKTSQIKNILDKVDSIEFTNPLRIAQKGMLRLSLNDVDGLTDLEQALALEPDQAVASSALARAYINNQLYDKALELGQNWIDQKPDGVDGYVLAAVSYANLKEFDLAEQMNKKALAIDPNNIAANSYFADKAKSEGDLITASSYFEKIIAFHPEHIPTLRKHFVVKKDLGDISKGLRPIESAFNRNTDKLPLRLLFAQALLTSEKYSEAIGVLESVSTNEQLPNIYWVVFGNAYYHNQQRQKALDITKNWVKQQPNNKSAYLRLIALQDLFKEYNNALEVTKVAHSKFPEDDQFTLLSIFFNIVTGDIISAERLYSSLSNELKSSVAGQGLVGQILLEKGDAISALPKLKVFYEQKQSQANASLVAKAFKELKQYSQAISFLQDHKMQVGNSIVSDIQIAELAIVSGDYPLAVKQYIAVLDIEPDNSRALNNLAYILVEQGNYQKALQYAQHAAELRPEHPAVLDTYGTTLFKIGQFNKAVEVFEKVYKLDKTDIQIALRFAEAMIAAKQTNQAEKILSGLKSDDPIIRAEIQRLKSAI